MNQLVTLDNINTKTADMHVLEDVKILTVHVQKMLKLMVFIYDVDYRYK